MLFVFGTALAARLALVVAIEIVHGGSLFLDDAYYQRVAGQMAAGATGAWSEYDHWLYDHTLGLLGPVTALFAVFGTSAFLAQGYVALLGSATAALTTRLGREVLPTFAAVAAGLIVALLPSQVLWSSLVLKDMPIAAALAAMGLAVAVANRSTGWRLVLMLCAAALCLVALIGLRSQTAVVAVLAMVAAVPTGRSQGRNLRVGGALMVGAVLPALFGLGLGGLSAVSHTGSLETRRVNNAMYAQSAFVSAGSAGTVPPSLPAESTTTAASSTQAALAQPWTTLPLRSDWGVAPGSSLLPAISPSPADALRSLVLAPGASATAAFPGPFVAGVPYRFAVRLRVPSHHVPLVLFAGGPFTGRDWKIHHFRRLKPGLATYSLTWTPRATHQTAYMAVGNGNVRRTAYIVGPASVYYRNPSVPANLQVRDLGAMLAEATVLGLGVSDELLYLPSGLRSLLLRPYPWEAVRSESVGFRLAALESLIWYPVLVLAVIGLLTLRRHRETMLFPVIVLLGNWTMLALIEGNIGTAIRHRSETVWVAALLAVFGAMQIRPWVLRRRATPLRTSTAR